MYSLFASAQEKCNDRLTCLNGGECMQSSTDADLDFCDCDGFSNGRFMGIDCSIEVPTDPSNWCNPNGDFCVNGGTCNEDISTPNVCNCPTEYTGKYCELEVAGLVDQGHIEDEDKEKPIEDVVVCDPPCEHGGVCTFGYRNPTKDHTVTAEDVTLNYQHCQCPHGFFGLACEREVNICGFDDDNKPEHVCHNSAPCVDPKTLDLDEDVLTNLPPHMCDCAAIGDSNTHYTGTYCEYENIHACNEDDLYVDSFMFCAKGGTCIQEHPDKPESIWLCDCAPAYTGKHCELLREPVEPIPGVPIPEPFIPDEAGFCKETKCENGGKCYFGTKDTSKTALGNMIKRPNEDVTHIIGDGVNEYYEHCQCPTGFTGVLCETEFTACAEGEYICFHGSTCVDSKDKCSCNEDGADTALAGQYCQHKATTKCGEEWCFNGGTCDDGVCRCPEGWRGAYCSFSDSVILDNDKLLTQSKLTENYLDKMNPNLIVLSGVLAFVGVLIIIVLVAFTDRNKEESYAVATTVSIVPPITAFPPSPTNSNDQNNIVNGEQTLDTSVSTKDEESAKEQDMKEVELI